MEQENKVRYSDEELEEFKEIILKKIEIAKRDYQQLMDALMNKGDNGVDDNKNGLTDCEEATCEAACASNGADSCSAAPNAPSAPLAALPFLALPALVLVRRRRRGN